MTDEADVKAILSQAKTIAVVGLSPDENKDSNEVGRYLQSVGYRVVPIYPKGERILGEKAYANLKEALIENHPDVVVAFRKSEACLQIAQEIVDSQTFPRMFWMQLGVKNAEAKALLQKHGIKTEENKCIKIERQRLLGA